ncbi:MAG: queuosine salvage family protein [Myxococcota bacterium]
MGLFDDIRASTRAVAERARSVRLDERRAAALAEELAGTFDPTSGLDPAHHPLATPEDTLAFVVIMDAINFGSGWFPFLKKRPGLSGYTSLASALREHFEQRGAWTSAQLTQLAPESLGKILGQSSRMDRPEVAELMELYAESLRCLGSWLSEKFSGRFTSLVEEAGSSAECLAELLAEMPFYRDVARYDDIEVSFYKRAQITASDLATAFAGEGWGRFHDLDATTIFADNLVPHVLRCEGVLHYADPLLEKIAAEETLPAGSHAEIEIRACAVHAVEGMVAGLRARGRPSSARELDFILWNRGQRPGIKAHPRHRTRCVFY